MYLDYWHKKYLCLYGIVVKYLKNLKYYFKKAYGKIVECVSLMKLILICKSALKLELMPAFVPEALKMLFTSKMVISDSK